MNWKKIYSKLDPIATILAIIGILHGFRTNSMSMIFSSILLCFVGYPLTWIFFHKTTSER